MARVVAITVCFLSIVVAASFCPRPAPPVLPDARALATPSASSANADEQRVLEAVNAERQRRGLVRLTLDARLTRAASVHARDLARRGTLDHRGSDGSNAGQRVTRAGYRWSAVAENLALAPSESTSPLTVVQMWMKSTGHRRNILNQDVTQMGLVHLGRIWVMVLARPYLLT